MNYKIQQENIQNKSIPTICTNLNTIINDLKKIEDECKKKISLQNLNQNQNLNLNQNKNLFLNISAINTIPAGTNKPQTNNSTNFWVSQLRK